MLLAFLWTEFLCEDHKVENRGDGEKARSLLYSKHCRAQSRSFQKHRAQNSKLRGCKLRDYDGMRPTTHYLHSMKNSGTTLPISSSKLQHLSTCTLVFSGGYYRAVL
jgi:hypothetical protein